MRKLLTLLAINLAGFSLIAQSPLNTLNFDGVDDNVSCTLPPLFNDLANSDFTFEAWIKPEAGLGRVFYAQVDPSNFATVLINNGNLLYYVKISNITYSRFIPTPPMSEWTHLAVTWDASELFPAIYLNGILQGGAATGASSSGINNTLTIGSRTDGAQPFMGEMDEVRIWNTTRTPCEIRSMMNSLPVGNESNLILHYNFNRGVAGGDNTGITILPDQAGLFSGTLNNFALNGNTSNWVISTAPIDAIGPGTAITTTASAEICDGDSYPFGAQTLTTSGIYNETFTSVEGCDSLVTLSLTVNNVYSSITNVSACSEYTWAYNGTNYTSSGQYFDTLQTIAGCDSVFVLNLTIGMPTAATQTITACGSYEWPLNGAIYTASGLYNDTISNSAGCDSVITLDLTILLPTSSIHNISACTSYEWPQTWLTYTASGIYTDTVPNAVGCDSVITLDLTILLPTASAQTVTACSSYEWPQTGMTYTASGLYTDTIPNAVGCDSVITLNLTISSPTSSTQMISACGPYEWSSTGITYTTSGLYNDTVLSVAGCDSVITLDLTILLPTSSTQTVSACNTYQWPQTGMTYTNSGLYTDTIPNAAGCDSLITLDLTISHPTTSTQTAEACGEYTWELNGEIYTESGFYSDTVLSMAGCDSIVNLLLIVYPQPVVQITHDGAGTLTATVEDGFVSEWIDCVTGLPVTSQPGQSTFMPDHNGTYAAAAVGFGNCFDTSDCFVVDFVGLSEQTPIEMSLYPNPAADDMTILFPGTQGLITVYDAHGKQLFERTIYSGEKLKLESFTPGIYFFALQTENGRAIKRVVKE